MEGHPVMTPPKTESDDYSHDEIVVELDRRITSIVDEFAASPLGMLLGNPEASPEMLTATIREIYWEIHCYQPITTRAGFAMIGATDPQHMKIMRVLLLHKWEEVEHRVWALDGYRAFGGDLSRIGRESEFTSTGAFAVAAVWERMSRELHPLTYVGAEYLFEELTARLAKPAAECSARLGLSKPGMRFIVDHASEDIKHSRLLKKIVVEVVRHRSDLHNQILYAFDCFRQVYPMPLWLESYRRAQLACEVAR